MAPALYISVGVICTVLTLAFIVLVITLCLCWKRKKNSMNTGDNVAYGVKQNVVDISDNVAYVASTSADKDKAAEAYVVTTGGNDIITTSQNEAYGTVPY